MDQRGSGLLIVIVAALLLAGAFLLFVARPSGSAVGGPGGSTVKAVLTLARTSTGVTATVTLTNQRSDDLTKLRISQASLAPVGRNAVPQASMAGGLPMPHTLGRLSKGAGTTFTIPFTGPAPASNTPMSLNLTGDYGYGWVGKGSFSMGITAILP